jgi:hypothetical protein
MAGLSMNDITNISFSWFNFLCFVSNLKLPKIKLMTLREVSRSGSKSMNGTSFFLCQMPSDKSAEFTINICPAMSCVAHSQFMLCYILLRPSELWVQFGLIGHFQWNATVVRSCATSEADGFPMQASTSTLPPKHS